MFHVIYIDVLGKLARVEFSDASTARIYAGEHAQSTVIHGDAVLDHYAGPRDYTSQLAWNFSSDNPLNQSAECPLSGATMSMLNYRAMFPVGHTPLVDTRTPADIRNHVTLQESWARELTNS